LNSIKKLSLIAGILAIVGIATQPAAASTRNFEVTVTNVTNNVTFTPLLGVTHTRAVSLFEVGEPASEALEDLAEGGSPAALIESFEGLSAVSDSTVATAAGTPEDGPFTAAGQSVTFNIEADRWVRFFSLAAMLLPTNDSFMALDSVRLPRFGTVRYVATGYDAGTELNDQLCANIPGPQCDGTPDGEGTNADRNDRGNFVHISSGIHDTGDLSPVAYDWRNPVAIVTITRLRY